MSLSDVSDLTELSSEDDVPLAKRTSKVKKESKEYKITHVLRAPRMAQYTAKSLYDQIIENSIDLDPDYQRDVVWQEEKQSGLIDSILRNYYIPPIIFAVTVQDDGSELRTCVDGKQRLTSIQRFIDGQIPHKDSFTNERHWFKSSATNTKRKLLPQHLRAQFVNKQIVCVEYTGLNNDQEREIFQRVQLGVALTPAERLQALVGPWSTTIHEIQDQVLGEEGFEGYLDWGHARGRDFQCIATIGYLIENHPKTAIPGTKTLEKWLQKSQPVPNKLRNDFHETCRIFVTLARDKKYSGSLNRPTRVSPIEFVMIGLLIYLKRQTLSLTQISSAIEKMRKDVRASHQDIRSNTRVTKHLMEFMAKRIKVSELRSDGEGDSPAALVIAKEARLPKRKRHLLPDDSDVELPPKVKPAKKPSDPMPAKAVGSSKQTSDIGDPKINGTKRAAAASSLKASLPAKPLHPSTSRRTTNNSLSNIYPIPANNSSLPTSATQTSHNRTLPPPSSASNNHNVHSGSIISNAARYSPLTVQTRSTVNAESPGSVVSPAALCATDRLAPIRAAKASLASGAGMQSPSVNEGSNIRTIPNPGVNPPQTPLDLRRDPVVPQPPVSQQLPLPPSSVQSLSQPLPKNAKQGSSIPAKVEGVLEALHSQFPQLGVPAQGMSNNAVNPVTVGQIVQSNGMPGHPMTPPTPGLVNPGIANNSGRTRYGVGAPQRAYNGSITSTQAVPNRASGSYLSHPRPLSMSGNMAISPPPPLTTNSSAPTPAGLHALPQCPAAITRTPTNSMRAEPLGPLSGSVSSGSSTVPDGRRGSYSRDRHHPPDDRRPNRNGDNQDFYRDKRNWHHPRP